MLRREYKKLEKNQDGFPLVCERQLRLVLEDNENEDSRAALYCQADMIHHLHGLRSAMKHRKTKITVYQVAKSIMWWETFVQACHELNIEYDDLACDAFTFYLAEKVLKEAEEPEED